MGLVGQWTMTIVGKDSKGTKKGGGLTDLDMQKERVQKVEWMHKGKKE